MSYKYQEQRPFVFREEGQLLFLEIRDRAARLLEKSGAVTSGKLMSGSTGDSWNMLAPPIGSSSLASCGRLNRTVAEDRTAFSWTVENNLRILPKEKQNEDIHQRQG